MLTQKRLKQLIEYDPDTGIVKWKIDAPLDVRHRWHQGRVGGYVRPDGYLSMSIDGKRYMVHRLIWFLITGKFPRQIDHKDMNGLNNRWENLREANQSQNAINRGMPKSNSLGYKGIWRADSIVERWSASIRIKGRKTYLGTFYTKEQAALTYNNAAKKHHGQFARLNKLVLFLFIFGWMMAPAFAIECRERPDGKSYWSYRLIENQRCWYRGHSVRSKSQLHWSDEPKPKPKFKGDPIFQIRAEETGLDGVTWHMARPFDEAQPIWPPLNIAVPDDPDACCWPDLSEFEGRFVGMQP